MACSTGTSVFLWGDDLAISNDAKEGSPQVHHYTYGERDG